MLWSFRFWTIALTSFSPVLHFTIFPIQSNVCRVLKPNGKFALIYLDAAEESLRNTEDEIDRLRVPSAYAKSQPSEMLRFIRRMIYLLNAVKRSSPQCCEMAGSYPNAAGGTDGYCAADGARDYGWRKNRLCPLLQRRKDSVRPLMDLKHRCKRRRVVKGVFRSECAPSFAICQE